MATGTEIPQECLNMAWLCERTNIYITCKWERLHYCEMQHPLCNLANLWGTEGVGGNSLSLLLRALTQTGYDNFCHLLFYCCFKELTMTDLLFSSIVCGKGFLLIHHQSCHTDLCGFVTINRLAFNDGFSLCVMRNEPVPGWHEHGRVMTGIRIKYILYFSSPQLVMAEF